MTALWVGKTGLDAQQTRMSVIANNLANVSTTGFKRGRAQFEDLLYQNVRQTGGQTAQNAELPSGLMLGAGTRAVSTSKLFTQGNIIQTGNNLDLAISGRGFFQDQMPDGASRLHSRWLLPDQQGWPDRHLQRLSPATRNYSARRRRALRSVGMA
jgi:flagellar basal-body rod protein FlgG